MLFGFVVIATVSLVFLSANRLPSIAELRPRPAYGLALGAALAAAVLTIGIPSPFIYFRF